MTNKSFDINNKSEESEELISIMEILSKIFRNWYWYMISVILLVSLTFLFIRYATPIYSVEADIKLKQPDQSRNQSMMAIEEALNIGSVDNVNDEAEAIRSRTTMRTAINRLNLHTSYITEGRITSTDLYKDSPVIAAMEQSSLDKLTKPIEFHMTMNTKNGLDITGIIGGEQIDTIFSSLPALLPTKYGNISFVRRENTKPFYLPIKVTIGTIDMTINSYRKNLKITPKGGLRIQTRLLHMELQTPYPRMGKDFLTMLIDVYNNEVIEDKNMEARNTQEFINERLVIIDKELSSADSNVEKYKRTQGLTDIQADLQRNLQMGSQYEQEMVNVETQLNIVGSLSNYLNDPENNTKSIPSNIGIQDPTLAATSSEYNKLLLERERLAQSMTEENPVLQRLDDQIKSLRTSINTSISSVQQNLNIKRRDARNQANIYLGRMGSMPTQEREFIDLTREQQIKQNLFLMLLQKREDNALKLAATSNIARLINDPVMTKQVFPRSIIFYLAAFLLGLILPTGFIFLVDLLQYKIRTRADVDRISKVPVLGEIPSHKEHKEVIVVRPNETTPLNEAFRMLRTNLLLSLGTEKKVVVCTSTIAGEGKTFIAINLAVSISLLNKKVLLIGMDLRIPKFQEYMKLNKKEGLTNYLSGLEDNIDNLIIQSELSDNLYVLNVGTLPPNPSELLSRNSLDTLMSNLRNKFDYIIIDSAPASLVTDTLIINRITDANIYVSRANFSSKMSLKYANQLMYEDKLKNMLVVINDVKDYYHGYGYSYGYGYGNKKVTKKRKRKIIAN